MGFPCVASLRKTTSRVALTPNESAYAPNTRMDNGRASSSIVAKTKCHSFSCTETDPGTRLASRQAGVATARQFPDGPSGSVRGLHVAAAAAKLFATFVFLAEVDLALGEV